MISEGFTVLGFSLAGLEFDICGFAVGDTAAFFPENILQAGKGLENIDFTFGVDFDSDLGFGEGLEGDFHMFPWKFGGAMVLMVQLSLDNNLKMLVVIFGIGSLVYY